MTGVGCSLQISLIKNPEHINFTFVKVCVSMLSANGNTEMDPGDWTANGRVYTSHT